MSKRLNAWDKTNTKRHGPVVTDGIIDRLQELRDILKKQGESPSDAAIRQFTQLHPGKAKRLLQQLNNRNMTWTAARAILNGMRDEEITWSEGKTAMEIAQASA